MKMYLKKKKNSSLLEKFGNLMLKIWDEHLFMNFKVKLFAGFKF